jgi:hypothetical protein
MKKLVIHNKQVEFYELYFIMFCLSGRVIRLFLSASRWHCGYLSGINLLIVDKQYIKFNIFLLFIGLRMNPRVKKQLRLQFATLIRSYAKCNCFLFLV